MREFIKEFSGAAMAISFMLCYVPQIIKIVKYRSSSDISPLMIIFGLSGYAFGLVYMFASNVFGLWWFANYLTGIITSTILYYYWYKHKND